MANRFEGLRRGHPWAAYVLPIIATSLTALLRLALDPLLADSSQFLLFYYSAVLVAVVAGLRAGLLAVVLGAVTGIWLFVQLGHVGSTWTDEITRLILFLLFGGATILMAGRLWAARNQAAAQAQAVAISIESLHRAEGELASVAQFPAENPHPILRIGGGGQVLYANRAAEALLEREGWARSEPAPAILCEPAVSALASGNPREFEFICRDGRVLAFLCVPLPDKGYTNLYGRDVTEARRLETALWQSKERLRLAQQVARIGSFEWDVPKNEYVWTPELEALYGLPPGGFGGSYEEWTALVHPDDLAAADQRVRESLVSGVFEGDWRVVWPDGTVRWLASRGHVFKNEAGQPVRMVGFSVDITKQKQSEEALNAARRAAEQAEAVAEQANRAKDHFLAVLSHELRTPLTPVMMAVSILQDNPDLDSEMHEMLEIIRRNLDMEVGLIDDLLDVTRISRGKIDLDRSPVELCTIIQRAVEVCKADIEARSLHFGVDLGPAAPYWVEADVPRLQQVFWNLLKNAIKFTPHNGCVGIRCQRSDGHVSVEVNDSGIGIEPESLEAVFNAFEQAERSITRKFGGLGLGLAISKALVELHGGAISAHSEGRNRGATFRIRLPLTTPAVRHGEFTPAAAPPATVRPLHILLVEDHGVTAMMMRMVLTSEGHTVETAGGMATALELASQHTFDLLISDLGLPDGSGHDMLRELRARGHEFPGIALSGYGREEDVRRSDQAGFAIHLTKPASREAIFAAVASAIAREDAPPQWPGS